MVVIIDKIVMILWGVGQYLGASYYISVDLRKKGKDPNVKNCYNPIHEVESYGEYAFRFWQWIGLGWIIFGLLQLILSVLGIATNDFLIRTIAIVYLIISYPLIIIFSWIYARKSN